MRNADQSMEILHDLSSIGVGISIDDFGTGYSSLLYLKRLPATELKIDRGFVRDLAQDSADAAIISAIIALGRTLNMRVVAEGVETVAQREYLTKLGCNSLQGFLLGRPVPAEQLEEAIGRTVVSTKEAHLELAPQWHIGVQGKQPEESAQACLLLRLAPLHRLRMLYLRSTGIGDNRHRRAELEYRLLMPTRVLLAP